MSGSATPTWRDFVMARLAAARANAQAVVELCDEAIDLFIDPEDDKKARDRAEAIENALDAAGATARALECAEAELPQIDPLECEPWDEDADEEVEDLPRAQARRKR